MLRLDDCFIEVYTAIRNISGGALDSCNSPRSVVPSCDTRLTGTLRSFQPQNIPFLCACSQFKWLGNMHRWTQARGGGMGGGNRATPQTPRRGGENMSFDPEPPNTMSARLMQGGLFGPFGLKIPIFPNYLTTIHYLIPLSGANREPGVRTPKPRMGPLRP